MENPTTAPDEKTTLVLVYTQNALIRGELVTKESARVSVWLRTQGVPNMIHILRPNVLLFGGASPRPLSHQEIFIPTISLIGFHLASQGSEPLDYEENEKNRSMEPVSLIMGTFIVKGNIRISSASSIANTLEVAYHGWMSIYNAEITNPFLPAMPPLNVPMLLVSPGHVNFVK